MKKKEITTTIREKVVFKCGLKENAERITLALVQAGYYVRIMGGSYNDYVVCVYTDRDL